MKSWLRHDARNKANLSIILIKNSVVILKEIKPENPEVHQWMAHDPKGTNILILHHIVFFWHVIVYPTNCKPKVWERLKLLFRTIAKWQSGLHTEKIFA